MPSSLGTRMNYDDLIYSNMSLWTCAFRVWYRPGLCSRAKASSWLRESGELRGGMGAVFSLAGLQDHENRQIDIWSWLVFLFCFCCSSSSSSYAAVCPFLSGRMTGTYRGRRSLVQHVMQLFTCSKPRWEGRQNHHSRCTGKVWDDLLWSKATATSYCDSLQQLWPIM